MVNSIRFTEVSASQPKMSFLLKGLSRIIVFEHTEKVTFRVVSILSKLLVLVQYVITPIEVGMNSLQTKQAGSLCYRYAMN